MTIVQVELRNGKEMLTTWVDDRSDLKTGKYITLKDFKPNIRWYVVRIYRDTPKDSKDFDFHRKWDNNDYSKHTGLTI